MLKKWFLALLMVLFCYAPAIADSPNVINATCDVSQSSEHLPRYTIYITEPIFYHLTWEFQYYYPWRVCNLMMRWYLCHQLTGFDFSEIIMTVNINNVPYTTIHGVCPE